LAALAPKVAITSAANINFFILSVVGISLTAIVQVKSEAHDKELYQQFKQDIDNEVADMRDLLRQHIMTVRQVRKVLCCCIFIVTPLFSIAIMLVQSLLNLLICTNCSCVICPALAPSVTNNVTNNINFFILFIGCAKTVDDVIEDF
jgi:hypothetical protein